MHIIISANQSWNIYNFRAGLIKQLIANGSRVTILAPVDRCSEKLKDLGCEVVDLPVSSQGGNPLIDGLLLLRFIWMFRKLRPDLVVNYTIKPNVYGSLAAGILNIPAISVVTGLGYSFINNGAVAALARFLYGFALRFADQVWFLNPEDLRTFVDHRLVNESRTFVLNGEGVNVDFYAPRTSPPGDQQFRFLLIGRMLKDKGVYEFVEAAGRLRTKYPRAVFQLLGPADVENPSAISLAKLKEWHDAGVVEYLGAHSDVRGYIAGADCVVLPSYREGVPRTLMEAAAMARPLIATDVPGCRSVVDDGINGYLCRAYEADDLSEKMESMLSMPSAGLRLMGERSRQKAVLEFDERLVIQKYSEQIGVLLGRDVAPYEVPLAGLQ